MAPMSQEITQATTGDAVVDQGASAALAAAWAVKVTDATNGPAAVKAASTAPAATDPALVVTFSPNGNTVVTGQTTSATATLTQPASSATSVSILASNASRKGWSVQNNSTQTLFIAFGVTASATVYNMKLFTNAFYESAPGVIYTGVINGIWASANGFAQINELT